MVLDQLARLEPMKFQELCAALLQRDHPNLRAVDGSGGDEGIDAWIPETSTYFQFHAPRLRVRREKMKHYLEQAAKHEPARWIFITNHDFTRAQWKWFDVLKQGISFPIEVWGATQLSERLLAHPDIVAHFIDSNAVGPRIVVAKQNAEQISNIAADVVNFSVRTRRQRPRVYISGVLANEPKKLGYLKHLARIYLRFKEWEVGKSGMNYARIYVAYEREMKCGLIETPIERFEEASHWFQDRIGRTKLGQINRKKGQRLFETFDEYLVPKAR